MALKQNRSEMSENLIELRPTGEVEIQRASDLLDPMLERLKRRRDGHEKALESPYADLNRLVPAFYGGDLVVVAGRPSMGKTAFAGSLALNASLSGPVLFFSLEMSAEQILGRLISSLSSLEAWHIQKGTLTDGQFKSLAGLKNQFADLFNNFYIVDSGSMCSDNVGPTIRRWVESIQTTPVAVFIDYLQLMATDGGHEFREKAVAASSGSAKRAAREFDVPVFLLSQLNRGVELRSNKRPGLADLRESGAIEQDADVVMMLYRGDYYQDRDSVEGETEIIVAKHRNGPTGTARIWFDSATTSFRGGD